MSIFLLIIIGILIAFIGWAILSLLDKLSERHSLLATLILVMLIGTIIGVVVYFLRYEKTDQGALTNPKICGLEAVVCQGEEMVGQEAENTPQGLVATQEGSCSWYDFDLRTKDQVCRSSGCWSKTHLTMASRDIPRGSMVRVENIENGKSVNVFVNDFGPEKQTGRICDLSSAAFEKLAPLSVGLIKVKIKQL